jgi:hypothetical protein
VHSSKQLKSQSRLSVVSGRRYAHAHASHDECAIFHSKQRCRSWNHPQTYSGPQHHDRRDSSETRTTTSSSIISGPTCQLSVDSQLMQVSSQLVAEDRPAATSAMSVNQYHHNPSPCSPKKQPSLAPTQPTRRPRASIQNKLGADHYCPLSPAPQDIAWHERRHGARLFLLLHR